MHCMASFFSYFASGGRKIAPTEKSATFARSGCAARTSASFSITHSPSRPSLGQGRAHRRGSPLHIQTVRRFVDRQAAAQRVKARTCVSLGSISSITA